MRYALRNQDKIAKAFGDDVLKRIIDSLDDYFKTAKKIESFQIGNELYETMMINDIGHTVNVIAFYIVEVKFDVLRLAFKEFIG